MSTDEVAEKIKYVSSLVTRGAYAEALRDTEDLEKQYREDRVRFNTVGFWIDAGAGLNDASAVDKGIRKGEALLGRAKNNQVIREMLEYNIGNGYYALAIIQGFPKSPKEAALNENLQKAASFNRLAINESSPNQANQLTNFGNVLDTVGRSVEALDAYDEALNTEPGFPMAKANRAMTTHRFASISGEYYGAILASAHKEISDSLKDSKLKEFGGSAAVKNFKEELKTIEARFKDGKVPARPKHPPYDSSGLSDFEKTYVEFCSGNRLFLNLHIHDDLCDAAITDPIFIQGVSKPGEEINFYHLAALINQIKEDYISARYLLVRSRAETQSLNRISERTTFVNTLEYTPFDLYGGLLKSSYRSAGNIFDKIAAFLNSYLNIGLNNDKVYWHTPGDSSTYDEWNIWENPAKDVRAEILAHDHPSLWALFGVYRDFKSGVFLDLVDLRNRIVHGTVAVIAIPEMHDRSKRSPDVYYISEEKMLRATIKYLKLTRAAVIYLINFVNSREKAKIKPGDKSFSLPIDTKQIFGLGL